MVCFVVVRGPGPVGRRVLALLVTAADPLSVGVEGRAASSDLGSSSASDLADDTDHDPADLDAGDADGFHGGIGGLEPDAVLLKVVALEGGLFSGKDGDDSLSVVGLLASLDQDQVSVADGVLDHGVALYAQGVDLAAGGDQVAQAELFRVLDGLDRGTGGDPSEDLDRAGVAGRLVGRLDGAAGVAFSSGDGTLAFELPHMTEDRDLVHSELGGDLLVGGGDAVLLAEGLEEGEDVSLTPGEGNRRHG